MKQLIAERDKKLFVINELKHEVDTINDMIKRNCLETVCTEFDSSGKVSGQISLNQGGVKITAERKKTVKWDNAKLVDIAEQMTPEQRADYLKTSVRMDEKVFKQIPDGEFKDALTDARTVTIGDTVIKAELGE